jgi:hypothetical protein
MVEVLGVQWLLGVTHAGSIWNGRGLWKGLLAYRSM